MTPAEHLARRLETEEPSEELRDAVNAFNGWQKSPDGFRWIKCGEGRNWATMPDPLHRRDDAAEMMPGGVFIELKQGFYRGQPCWMCAAYGPDGSEYDPLAEGCASTEPCARTAAAIRAKGTG